MKINQQFDAIMALPIGGVVLACAVCFFLTFAALVNFLIERRRDHRANLAELAARMSGHRDA